MTDIVAVEHFLDEIAEARRQIREHDLYRSLTSPRAVRIFMENHVFAVWDFMSLLKFLQSRLSFVIAPWVPRGDPVTRRLINEIVLVEESDDLGPLGCFSHFELYRRAMQEAGADCGAIDRFVAVVEGGAEIDDALVEARAPAAAQAFVTSTFRFLATGEAHIVAAAFAFGREEPIPTMFRGILDNLLRHFPGQFEMLGIYLDRHISVDENEHAPLAERMLAKLCGESPLRWREATDAASAALHARLGFWDEILDAVAAAD